MRAENWRAARSLVRYADDLVVFCHIQAAGRAGQGRLAAWLEPRGLAFNEAKTDRPPREGFDFLGFNVRRYPTASC